jgi:DNA-binding PadR family transcriptional regulator
MLSGERESAESAAARRPRRYYRLRSGGAGEAREALDEWERTKSVREASPAYRLRHRPA